MVVYVGCDDGSNRERLSCSIALLIAAAVFWLKRGGREELQIVLLVFH